MVYWINDVIPVWSPAVDLFRLCIHKINDFVYLQERIVLQNETWVALVPYWAMWPYETMLLPLSGQPQRLSDLSEEQKTGLADIMKGLNTKYDNLFKCSFPYSMGFHGEEIDC